MRKQPLTEKLKRRRYRPRLVAGRTPLDREYAARMQEAERAPENQVVEMGAASASGAIQHLKLRPSTDIWVCRHGVAHPDICGACTAEHLDRDRDLPPAA